MKKELMSISLVVSMICLPSTHAAEREKSRNTNRLEQFDKFSISRNNIQENIVAKDQLSSIVLGTNSLDSGSLDEEETKVRILSSLIISDKIITLVSKIDGAEIFGSYDHWIVSKLVAVAMSDGPATQFRRPEDKEKVFLEETSEEIRLLDRFLTLDEKKKGVLLHELSIFDSIVLLANLRIHSCIKEFDCNYFNDCSESLENKIGNLLKQTVSQDLRCLCNEIDEWSSEAKEILENAIRGIIRPIPTVLFKCNNTESTTLNADKTNVIVHCLDGRVVIVNLKNREVIFNGDKTIALRFLNPNGTWILVQHENGKGEIVDIEKKKILLTRNNTKSMFLNSDKTKVTILYKNDKAEIINLKDEKTFFEQDNVTFVTLHARDKKVEVNYKNGNTKIITLAGETVLYDENNIELVELNQTSTIVQVQYENGRENGRKEIISLEGKGTRLFGDYGIKDIDLNGDETRVIVHYLDDRVVIVNPKNKSTLFSCNNVEKMHLNSDRTKAIIVHKIEDGSKGEIRSLENGALIFQRNYVEKMNLNKDGTRVIIHYLDDSVVIVNPKNESILFQSNNVEDVILNETDRLVIIYYVNDTAEIRDSINGEQLFSGSGIREFDLDQAEMKAIIKYEDKKAEIRDLKKKIILFEAGDVKEVSLNPTSTRAVVEYLDGKTEIIDLEDCDRNIVFTKLKSEELRFIFMLKNSNSPDAVDNFIATHYDLWKSFDSNLKHNLLKFYFSQEKREAIQTIEKSLEIRVTGSAIAQKQDGPPRKKHKTTNS